MANLPPPPFPEPLSGLPALFERMPEGMVICARDPATPGYRIIAANRAFRELAGISADQGRERQLAELLPFVRAAAGWESALDRAAAGDDPLQFELADPLGNRQFRVAVYRLEQSQLALLVREVTRQHQLEARLRHAQTLEALGTLTGGIAHDFNNILGIIIGYAELVQAKLPPRGQEWQDLEELLQAGLRARDLVAQLLLFGRRGDSQPRPLELAPLLKEGLKLLRAALPANIGLATRLPEAEPPLLIQGDPTLIHQILMRLCTTAAQAIPWGGSLTVTLERVVPAATPLTAAAREEPAPQLQLSVSSSGMGSDPGSAPRIFTPFLDSGEVEGTAEAGLAVVREQVAALGGEFDMTPVPAGGTGFEVRFPLVAPVVVAPPAVADPRRIISRLRVLVVDDEPQLLQVVCRQLESLGCRTVATTAPEAVWEIMERNPVDLVITDQTLPTLTGVQLSDLLRQRYPQLPVAITSGLAPTAGFKEPCDHGFVAFLQKPVLIGELFQLVYRIAAHTTLHSA